MASRKSKLILIVAGGTGGHLYPALATARALRRRLQESNEADAIVAFVVKKGDLGKLLIEKEKFPVIEFPGQGLPRGFSPKIFLFPFVLLKAFFQAEQLIKKLKPSVVLGMGGYLSFPVLVMAKIKRTPTVIHEQNVLPGLANRLLAKIVNKVALSFDQSATYFPSKKIHVTGLPVREELGKAMRAQSRLELELDPLRPTILIFGGSLGAKRLNELFVEALQPLKGLADRMQILHVTGHPHFPEIQKRYAGLPFRSKVMPYCQDMAQAYAAADAVVSRSGASTIAELMVVSKPALLIPYPHATGNHQALNAQMLSRLGQAKMILEAELTAKKFSDMLREMLTTIISSIQREKPAVESPWGHLHQQAADELASLVLDVRAGKDKPSKKWPWQKAKKSEEEEAAALLKELGIQPNGQTAAPEPAPPPPPVQPPPLDPPLPPNFGDPTI